MATWPEPFGFIRRRSRSPVTSSRNWKAIRPPFGDHEGAASISGVLAMRFAPSPFRLTVHRSSFLLKTSLRPLGDQEMFVSMRLGTPLTSFFLWLPSLRILQRSSDWVNAIHLPSGDHDGLSGKFFLLVMRVRSLPFGLTVQMPGRVSPSIASLPFLPG